MKGWRYEPARHSLASRGVKTADIVRKLAKESFRYGNRLGTALEKIRLNKEEMDYDEYRAFYNLIDDLKKNGKITDKDILEIDHKYGHIIGVPMHTGWDIVIMDSGRLEGTEFEVHNEVNAIAGGKLILLGSDGEVINWGDEDVYERRDEILGDVEAADLEFEWMDENIDRENFLKNSMPFILKLARVEGVDLEYSDDLSKDEIKILKNHGFKVIKTTVSDAGIFTRMMHKNPREKYEIQRSDE